MICPLSKRGETEKNLEEKQRNDTLGLKGSIYFKLEGKDLTMVYNFFSQVNNSILIVLINRYRINSRMKEVSYFD